MPPLTVATSTVAMIFSSVLMGPILSRFSLARRGASGLAFTSGGKMTYSKAGMRMREMRPEGGKPGLEEE